MKKRSLLMILALALSLTLAIGGTLAYLQDTDADVNVMTLGSVYIVQNEQERDESGDLVEFRQNKDLYPAVYKDNSIPWAEPETWPVAKDEAWKVVENNPLVVDKFVTVTNTGKSDAYVRTIIAYEGDAEYGPEGKYIHVVHNGSNVKPEIDIKCIGTVKIDGVDYTAYVYTYPAELSAGETSIPSLKQVYMDKSATNDVMTHYGDQYDILVLSQAVQADGFDTPAGALDAAFGVVDADNVAKWMSRTGEDSQMDIGSPSDEKGPDRNPDNNPPKKPNGDNQDAIYEVPADAYRVTNATELTAAVANGKTTLLLAAGEYDIDGCTEKKLTLVGEDDKNTVIVVKGTGEGEGNGQLDYGFDSSTVTFQNLTIKTNNQTYAGYARLVGTYKNVTFENCYCLNSDSQFENCTFNVAGNQYNLWTWGAPTATFTNCTFNSDGKAILLYGTANTKLTLTNCVFNDTGVLPDLKTAVEIGNDYNKSYELIVNNVDVNGYEENPNGIKTGSTLWSNKNSMSSDNLNVVIDGYDVY